MKIEDFLAFPGEPCIRIRVGPGLDAVVEVSQEKFDQYKEDLRDYCLALEEDPGSMNWRAFKRHTDGNGLMAKLLLGLGHLAEAWTIHPPLDAPASMWNKEHPRIFQVTGALPAPSRAVPKPSAGDLETTLQCVCCDRGMGPTESAIHDLVASGEDPRLCIECAVAGCEAEGGPCEVFPDKLAEEKPQRAQEAEEESEDHSAPPGLSAYLKQFE